MFVRITFICLLVKSVDTFSGRKQAKESLGRLDELEYASNSTKYSYYIEPKLAILLD